MIKIKPFVILGTILFVITLMLPAILVLPFMEEKVSGKLGEELAKKEETIKEEKAKADEPSVEVAVYRKELNTVEKLDLNEYIVGVVASEMPASFEAEALKAQALTARTFIVKKLVSNGTSDLPQGATVDDTENDQVYKNRADLQKLWGSEYNWKIKRIEEAVEATKDQVLTYDGEPIEATFFSTSNGYTENSDAIWPNALPYLTSVSSPWDKNSPKYSNKEVISVADFEQKLGVKLIDNGTVGTVIERTKGKRVSKVVINGKELTGVKVRDQLALKSTDFTWERQGNDIVITTKGYGHGVGMSQYGANGMAQEGKNYKEIVKHYYKGIEVTNSDSLLNKYVAKK